MKEGFNKYKCEIQSDKNMNRIYCDRNLKCVVVNYRWLKCNTCVKYMYENDNTDMGTRQ